MTAIQQSIRTFITAVLAFLWMRFFHWPEGYWFVIAALLLVQINSNMLQWRNNLIILVTGSFMALNLFFANSVSQYLILITCYLFITTFAAIYVGSKFSNLLYPAIIINICGIISSGFQVSSHYALFRVSDVLLGTVMAIAMRSLFWPSRAESDLRYKFINFLQTINRLQEFVFYIYLKRNYSDKHYAYEKEFHSYLQELIVTIHGMQNRLIKLKNNRQKYWEVIIDRLNQISEVILALGNLRYRITDHSTFEVCEKELRAISIAISDVLNNLIKLFRDMKKMKWDVAKLQAEIKSFENIYQSTLQVVINEPLIFLIFIQNLSDLVDELNLLAAEIVDDK